MQQNILVVKAKASLIPPILENGIFIIVYGLRAKNRGCQYHLAGIAMMVIFIKLNMLQNKIGMIDISKVGPCAF